jgi:hypothetical protein
VDAEGVDPGYAFALALTDHQRTFRAMADAISAAAGPADLTPTARAGLVTRELVDRYMLLDTIAVQHALMAVCGYLAQRTGKTPRQIHESLFKNAPSDEWWRDRIGGDDEG